MINFHFKLSVTFTIDKNDYSEHYVNAPIKKYLLHNYISSKKKPYKV